MSQEAPFSGQLKALRACGFCLINSNPPGTEISLIFFVAGYELVGNSYVRYADPFMFFLTIDASNSFGCDELNIPNGGLQVSKGDKAGVFAQQAYYCNQFAINSPIYTCQPMSTWLIQSKIVVKLSTLTALEMMKLCLREPQSLMAIL